MGWSAGMLDGRDVGYGIDATCDRQGCDAKINRGLAYRCGEDINAGCGRYFCYDHLDVGPCEHPTMWDEDEHLAGRRHHWTRWRGFEWCSDCGIARAKDDGR